MGAHERDHAVVPLRNLVLAVSAASMGYGDVVLAAATEWAADKRLAYTLTATAAMRVAEPGRGFRVRRPFRMWTKSRLIRHTPPEFLAEFAYSCYRGSEPPCGECYACRRVAVAHLAAGRRPPTPLPVGLNRRDFVRWLGVSYRGLHPGALTYWPIRALEIWRAWRAYKREAPTGRVEVLLHPQRGA